MLPPFPRSSWPTASMLDERESPRLLPQLGTARKTSVPPGVTALTSTRPASRQSSVTCHLFGIFERASPLEEGQCPPSCMDKAAAQFRLSLSPSSATRLPHASRCGTSTAV